METTIFRTIKGSQMEQLFEADKDYSIRFYKATDVLDSGYSKSKKYKFEITIRHAEGTNADDLFDKAFCKLFPTKIKRMRTFIYSISERKDGNSRITANVYEIKKNLPKFVGEVKWNTASFRGEDHTVMNFLGKTGILPKKYAEGYIYNFKEKTFNILAV
jgi:hypothetical protein